MANLMFVRILAVFFGLASILCCPVWATDECRKPLENPLLQVESKAIPSGSSGLWYGSRAVEGARAALAGVSQRLIQSHFQFAVRAGGAGNLPSYLSPQMLIYIINDFNLEEQIRLATVLDFSRLHLEESVERVLVAAGDPSILAKAAALDSDVKKAQVSHKASVALALEYHDKAGKKYGNHPYSTHLRNVRAVLKRFGFGPKNSLLGLKLGTVAWLHDILEDTPVTKEMIQEIADEDTADIVSNLTNEPDMADVSAEDRKRITFERVARRPESRIVKLADRISNIEESLTNQMLGQTTKIEKYYREWPAFKKYIYRPGEAEKMWEHLERLLTDESYALQYILYSASR